jgi:VWFA-related protein
MMSNKHVLGIIVALSLCASMCAQQQSQQQLPDGPSATKPLPKPSAVPAPEAAPPPASAPLPDALKNAGSTPDASAGGSIPVTEPQAIPAGRPAMPGATTDEREQLFTLSTTVNFVTVPVTVKDSDNRLVTGLLANDFSVYENGARQDLKFFSSDPFPLSAAVVVDLALPEQVFNKVRQTLSALSGAFSPYDELAVYTYATTVSKVSDFTAVNAQLDTALRRVKAQSGSNPGVTTVGGPMQSGPTVNGMPVDPGAPHTPRVQREDAVLSDAILQAALDLARRDQAPHWRQTKIRPRKILFVISDGRENGSHASYDNVLKVLLSNNIAVYAIAVGNSATPVFGTIQKIKVPGVSPSNYLPKYASATGGQVYTEGGQSAIEDAYGRVTSEARNQYTLGYSTRLTPSNAYRSIEVRVKRENVKVYARDGYYPAPPLQRSTQPPATR